MMIIFLIATFIIQITFLNMLIAVMGDTFSKVMERINTSKMRERIHVLSDYSKIQSLFYK